LISLFAASSGFAAIRAFRVLRVLRVVTIIPRMRTVVSALLEAIPGIASVGVVVILIVYVFAVIGSSLYGDAHPAIFGDVFTAMYTLFQVMTLEGWPDIAAQVSTTHPRSWAFFLTFVLIATFTMLNLFVAIVVRAVEEDTDPLFAELVREHAVLHQDIKELKAMVAELAARPK
jgi:voltage-gated sodium channel